MSSGGILRLGWLLVAFSLLPAPRPLFALPGELELSVVDADTGEPIAVRMHLYDPRGRPRKIPGAPFWNDHFCFQGKIVLRLSPGTYQFVMERGPEYRVRTGHFVMRSGAADNRLVEMERFVDMKKEGWWSGDLHIHRPLKDIEVLMLAEDLHVAPVITWWRDKNPWLDREMPDSPLVRFRDDRLYHMLAGEDEREGGALLFFNLPRPLPIAGSDREYPSPAQFLVESQAYENAHVDIEKPFWWDVPVFIASGHADSIGLANNHMQRDGMLANEAWGKPRDRRLYPDPHGNGRWSEAIYYELLNCGVRIPPSAGSASGVLKNPVGYNRVYVHCGDQLDYDQWWEGLRAGRVVVTNGPLIRPRVNGQLPGHVFRAEAGERITLDIDLRLALRDKVEYLEIIRNGRVFQQVRLDEYAKKNGRLPVVPFDKSGWMLVRAVTNNPKTYRFASTGPYYVEIGGQRRISRKSAQMMLDWTRERMENIKLPDPRRRQDVMRYHTAAERYWRQKVQAANAP